MSDRLRGWPVLVYEHLAAMVANLNRLVQVAGKYTLDERFEVGWGDIVLDVDPDDGRMYVTDPAGTVYAADLDGSNRTKILVLQGNLTGMARAVLPTRMTGTPPAARPRSVNSAFPVTDGVVPPHRAANASVFSLWVSSTPFGRTKVCCGPRR